MREKLGGVDVAVEGEAGWWGGQVVWIWRRREREDEGLEERRGWHTRARLERVVHDSTV